VISTESLHDTGRVVTTDIVPELNRSVAATTDAAASFQSAMRAGVALCLRESQAMKSSAAALLSGVELQYLAPSGDPKTLTGFTDADRAKWQAVFDMYGDRHMLVPTNPAVGALWIVDRTTGSTIAVFIDGSGGGADACDNATNNAIAQTVIALLQAAITLLSLECPVPAVGFACVGAVVFGVGASAAAVFAGAYFEQPVGDVVASWLISAIEIAGTAVNPAAGLILYLLVFMASLGQDGAIHAACTS
jgi:hypothetical protein